MLGPQVSLLPLTQTLEVIYIAFAESTRPTQQTQSNVFDPISWQAKANISTIGRGWLAVVDWSHTVLLSGARRFSPQMAEKYQMWEELSALCSTIT